MTGVLGRRPCLDPLMVVEPDQIRDEALDDEHPARIEHASTPARRSASGSWLSRPNSD